MIRSHREVHPVRNRLALAALVASLAALAVFGWNHRQAADQIEQAVRAWID